ncbi:hypothetical protein BDQ12DRAFT_728261 [Crucibulum laeve]|uniref:Uncharacterized protein n=1 Tax=Crucibulum laeve TaxID=68775 RepID=A0A5C3LLQ4_9AGAR|nr:hypothetical protein BDQ12DRAFT_728261 [Crucibulum laeve]
MLPRSSSSKSMQPTTATQSASAPQYSPAYIQRFLKEISDILGIENDENLRNTLVETHGTIGEAVYQTEVSLQIGNQRPLERPPAVTIGEKPKPGDQYGLTQLANNVTVRVWGTGLECLGLFCFDFVYTDNPWRYMVAPKDIWIEAIGAGGVSHGLVLSIEKSMHQTLEGNDRQVALNESRPFDANSENYVISEGTHIRIWQSGIRHDLVIPLHDTLLTGSLSGFVLNTTLNLPIGRVFGHTRKHSSTHPAPIHPSHNDPLFLPLLLEFKIGSSLARASRPQLLLRALLLSRPSSPPSMSLPLTLIPSPLLFISLSTSGTSRHALVPSTDKK